MAALVGRLQKAEERRQELAMRLRALGDSPVIPRIDWRHVERRRGIGAGLAGAADASGR
jgi:hypothetical protein